MTRREARELILQFLFQYEYTGKKPDKNEIKDISSKKNTSNEIVEFIENIVSNTIKHIHEIDRIIQSVSKNWDINRLPSVDKNIIRYATYELLYRKDIPPKVAINEAVDIAKKYSTSDSYAFINGVLDKIAREHKRT